MPPININYELTLLQSKVVLCKYRHYFYNYRQFWWSLESQLVEEVLHAHCLFVALDRLVAVFLLEQLLHSLVGVVALFMYCTNVCIDLEDIIAYLHMLMRLCVTKSVTQVIHASIVRLKAKLSYFLRIFSCSGEN